MACKPEFEVSYWSADRADTVIAALRSQLESAKAVWPELKRFQIVAPIEAEQ